MLGDLAFPLPHATNRRGSGSGADHTRMTRFPKIPFLPYIRSHLWLGNSQKDKVHTTPEFFFWQSTIGHIAWFKVTQEPHGTNVGQEQTMLAQSFTIKPEQVFQKLTISGRQPLEAGPQETQEKPFTLRLSGLFFLGPLSWASKSLPF